MSTAIALFNRDLRVRDNPALAAAAQANRTVPLFVLDEKLLGSRFAAPNRVAFLLEALRDLDDSLRGAGARLYLRRGDPVAEAIAVARECGAEELHVSADWSAYAQRREERLRDACEEERGSGFRAHAGTTVIAPGTVTPAGGDHFKVFTPFHRAWERGTAAADRREAAAARRCRPSSRSGDSRPRDSLLRGSPSPDRASGGESEGRRLMRAFLRDGIADYEDRHDDLPGDATSGLSPYLRFGCLSPLELLREAGSRAAAAPLPASSAGATSTTRCSPPFPALPKRDYRPRGDRWSRSRARLRRLARGPHRLPGRRRGDAAAAARGPHA